VFEIHDVPFRLLVATAKDQFRKPMPGIWNELDRIFKAEGVFLGLEFQTSGF
jgi:bifunctional polynucleotide phosphatase/kinase